MKTLLVLAAVPIAAAALLARPIAQKPEPTPPPANGRAKQLAPVDPSQDPLAQDHPQDAASFDARSWEAGLASSSLDERERAYQEMLSAARRDRAALDTVRQWAKDESDVDRAWNARLALRELSLTRDPFDGFTDPFGGAFGQGMPDVSRLFGDMQRQLDELLNPHAFSNPKGFSNPNGNPPPLGSAPQGPNGTSRSQSFSMESGPDGVKVHVKEFVDGKEEEKTYEAKSLDELLQAYPELRDRIQIGPGLSGAEGRGLEGLRERLHESPFEHDDADASGPLRTDRLGVRLREPGEYDAAGKELEPGVGLYVEEVLPHSLASELGLQQGDVLVELNGKRLTSAQDVRDALASRKKEEPVVLKLVDALGQKRSVTWDPGVEDAPKGPVPLKQRI